MHRALKQAARDGIAARNVAELVDRPRAERKEMRVLTPAQVATFLNAAEGDRLAALYRLAITTGMRQGECLGLGWADVDLEAAQIKVRHQLQTRVEGGPSLTEPKTARGRRVIDLSPLDVQALQRHRIQQLKDQLALGEAWRNDLNLVFVTQAGGPLDPSNVRHAFARLLTRAELPRIRFHDVRHTAATLMLAAGVHPKVVSERLGHASVAFTLDTYTHYMPSMGRKAAGRLDALLAAADGGRS
jgi:integrase